MKDVCVRLKSKVVRRSRSIMNEIRHLEAKAPRPTDEGDSGWTERQRLVRTAKAGRENIKF
jgi:hypothetical protein